MKLLAQSSEIICWLSKISTRRPTSKSAPVIMKLKTPVALIGFLPFSLNLKETLSLTFFLMGFDDIAAHYSSIIGSWIASGLPNRPQTKFGATKTRPLP